LIQIGGAEIRHFSQVIENTNLDAALPEADQTIVAQIVPDAVRMHRLSARASAK
jgi:hypothetical protein